MYRVGVGELPKKWCINHSIITTRIPKEWGRYYFHRCVSVHISGGMGYPHLAHGGTPILPKRRVPTSFLMEGTPSQVRIGPDVRWGTPFGTGWGYPSIQVRSQVRTEGVPPTGTAQHVLAMWRAVCLLRSRRRTFLFLVFLPVSYLTKI